MLGLLPPDVQAKIISRLRAQLSVKERPEGGGPGDTQETARAGPAAMEQVERNREKTRRKYLQDEAAYDDTRRLLERQVQVRRPDGTAERFKQGHFLTRAGKAGLTPAGKPGISDKDLKKFSHMLREAVRSDAEKMVPRAKEPRGLPTAKDALPLKARKVMQATTRFQCPVKDGQCGACTQQAANPLHCPDHVLCPSCIRDAQASARVTCARSAREHTRAWDLDPAKISCKKCRQEQTCPLLETERQVDVQALQRAHMRTVLEEERRQKELERQL